MQESAGEEWEDDEDAAEASDDFVAVSNVAEPSADLVRPDLIERVFKSLAADAERGDGHLKRSDINRTYLRKQLSIAECIEVEGHLVGAGCAIVEDDEDVPVDDDAAEYAGSKRKVRYLTHAEERELGRRIQLAAQLPHDTSRLDADYVRRVKRDAEMARGAFVASNLRYVEMLARRRGEHRYIATDDLKQEGVIGLLRAVELYDPERGFRFKTYATWWIEQRMERAIADEDRIVRLPVHLHEKLVKIRRARSKLTFANGRPPTEDELADALGIERERLMKLLWRVQATEVAEGDSLIAEDVTLLSVVPDQGPSQFDILSQRELEERFKDLLSTLTPREERILRMRFGVGLDHDRTLQSIGDEYNVTRERIRQIEEKALRKLKHPSRSRHLRDFLDT
ncbi:sigma-70 family RNA polymerase sigma factor [Ancylobacter sp. MQZ15Z-1]|uniref:Sigma-70 family RNA polymerase sigma factor n=1 Tax=Ancylobacter mangrovi TaxID=2972472 RepID=A0A9X2PKF4_9HYPH|nr:sigma-70 family RNA polymerase sigma factor [Ancylobacter mangrovi]MCS0495583.1 sigma-70 family RNA polymerase sigma factor [Ancylobacter mangrovi]